MTNTSSSEEWMLLNPSAGFAWTILGATLVGVWMGSTTGEKGHAECWSPIAVKSSASICPLSLRQQVGELDPDTRCKIVYTGDRVRNARAEATKRPPYCGTKRGQVMNRRDRYERAQRATLLRSDSGDRSVSHIGLSSLWAAFSRWEPERPELLIRLRPRVRDLSRHVAR